jgi:hypothetical protein
MPADATNPIAQVQAFSDRNSDGQLSAGEPILASFYLPNGITFTGAPGDAASVIGFSADPGGGTLPNIAIFLPSGTLFDKDNNNNGNVNGSAGAFRLADPNDNYVAISVTSAGTPIPKLLKWDGSAWRAKGDNKETWQWN